MQGGEKSSPLESEEVKSNEDASYSLPNKNEVPMEKSLQDEISHKDEGDTSLPLNDNEDSAVEEGRLYLISKTNVSS